MRCTFPYFEDRPHIPIILHYRDQALRFLPLLDTGADFCVFSKFDAMRLGLDWKTGERAELSNADGSTFEAWKVYLPMSIEGYDMKVKVCFVDNPHCPMPLLGRTDVFKNFQITIDEKEKVVKMRTRQ